MLCNTLPVDGDTAGLATLQDELLVDGVAFERISRSWIFSDHSQYSAEHLARRLDGSLLSPRVRLDQFNHGTW
ncbi:hypothetical protein XH92_35630 [Bradyrhizobium sp. CCBAU 53421]|nr:hypothetical protein XH92_35630 [Bradyrhizobium sp. CCBAU 53421]